MTEIAFTPERLDEVKKLIAKYEYPDSALLPVLYMAQDDFKYITPAVMNYVAEILGIPAGRVFEVVSFYSMFRTKDLGRYCIQICNNVSCSLLDSESLIQAVKEELHLSPGQVSEDGLFSLVTVECLGACDKAPSVQVNEEYVDKVTPETLKELIRKLRDGKAHSVEEATR